MATHVWQDLVHDMRDEAHDIATIARVDAARQAYLAMWATFVVLPLVFGIDKLGEFLTSSWEGYLATWIDDALPGSAADAMLWFGGVEIVLAALVLFAPRIGGDLLALWMLLAAVSLVSIDGMGHLAVGALALGVCALAMARMSTGYHHHEVTT